MNLAPPRTHLNPAGIGARFWALLRSAAIGAYRDDCLEHAKGAAYSSLIAFFPVITALAALLVEAHAEGISRTIAGLLYQAVPPGTEDVVRRLFVIHGRRPTWLLVAATLLAIFAASGAMLSLMEGFRTIYRIPKGRPVLRERAVAMALVLTCAFPLVGASALIVFGNRTEVMLLQWFGTGDFTIWLVLAGTAFRYVLAFGSFVAITALAYYFGPNRRQKFRHVLPGAILTTLLWLLSTLVFGWYVRHISNYNVLYGSVGAGLALAVWMYVLAVTALFGCEFNAALERYIKRSRQK